MDAIGGMTPARQPWRRGDILIEPADARLRLHHRSVVPDEMLVLSLDQSSPLLSVLHYLDVPRSDAELIERFANLNIYAVIRLLSQKGLIFRGAAAEKAFVLRHRAIRVLRLAETMAHNALGLGTWLFEDEQSEQGDAIAGSLAAIEDQLLTIDDSTRSAIDLRLNSLRNQWQPAAQSGSLQLNLGCGRQHVPGWLGIDVRGGELRMNLRWGLPFPDGAARYIYTAHFIEHLHVEDAARLLTEAWRVLRPGGVLRVIVPDVGAFIAAYQQDDHAFIAARCDVIGPPSACATPLAAVLNYAGADTQATDLGGHRFGYDFTTLAALLRRAGFTTIERSGFNASQHPALRIDDTSEVARSHVGGVYHSLFVEAIR